MKTNKGIVINGGKFHGNVVSIGNMNVNNYHSEQETSDKVNRQKHKYDVALSYAGEDRSYVEIIAKELKARDIKVFYDEFEEASLWGKDLSVYLDQLFSEHAAFCVMFISEIYTKKAWCNLERNSAMHRQYRDGEYILPVCLDQTSIPGITDRYGFLEAKDYSPVQLADVIVKKLNEV
ncbi:TIR domain-containing protein [Paenibacillus macerans]|uniref:TIR domain-containing protein n=1 Tax=Paenibacillus macerans TaxID=44252 RepID=UPI000ED39D60|nr:TIR domain-containing protein [Paenibacillus macerans]GBK66007.1 TIR domain-containing protein [Paenibacillus macerans]GBK72336.1 TIR domain-containing protein [Paenibacillus macerans]